MHMGADLAAEGALEDPTNANAFDAMTTFMTRLKPMGAWISKSATNIGEKVVAALIAQQLVLTLMAQPTNTSDTVFPHPLPPQAPRLSHEIHDSAKNSLSKSAGEPPVIED